MPMPKVWNTNAAEALKHLQARYAQLSAMAESALKTSKAIGAPVPQNFIQPYGAAVRDYRAFGEELFSKLGKMGLSVEQVIFRHGKPETMPNDPTRFRTVKISTPLVPPVFSTMAGETEIGAAPLVMGLYIIGGLVVTGASAVIGYFTVKALKEVRIMLRGPDYEPDKQADAVLKVFEGFRKGGASPDKAAELSTRGTAPPEGSSSGHKPEWFGFGTAAAVAALGLGGLLFLGTRRSAPAPA